MSPLLFDLFAVLAVTGALGMVASRRNPVVGALSLAGSMVALGGIYVLLDAYLIGALQILVYAGAIVVLFLFVVMLLNLRSGSFGPERQRTTKVVAAALGALLGWALATRISEGLGTGPPLEPGFGGYREIGWLLFTDYVLAFEVASLLLLAAMVGAVVLARREPDDSGRADAVEESR